MPDKTPGPVSYVGRFAPSPTGPLHAGSLVAALASWLDARAHGGRWLVRIEDIDTPRCVAGADHEILRQLAACGLRPDDAPAWQSRHEARHRQALESLQHRGEAYSCTCSRTRIAAAQAAAGSPGRLVYPGTCRPACRARTDIPTEVSGHGPAWRLRTHDEAGRAVRIAWHDRRLGPQSQDVAAEVGDFVLKRADGLWAYQLAVVVDDAAQGVTHVVRGADLADNTARQIHLQRLLGLPTPHYLHTPLVFAADGQKLSKQTGAQGLALRGEAEALDALRAAAQVLGLGLEVDSRSTLSDWLAEAVRRWPKPL